MKVSNETKVGALAAVSITLLILGFNYLKGKNIFSKAKTEIYAVFDKVDGLNVANPVTINGLQIGKVYEMHEKDKALTGIVVTINLTKDVDIPKGSYASISSDLLGTTTLTITKSDGKELMQNGDTLLTQNNAGLIEGLKASLNPALVNVNGAVKSLDSLLKVVGSYFDPATKNNFHAIIANLTKSSANLQILLDAQTGSLAKALGNVNSFTANLAKNNSTIDTTLSNLSKATGKFANMKLDETLGSLQGAVTELKGLMAKANSKEGSIGLLLNDPKLYRNLESTTYKLNILLDDFRTHPKRYVNVSVFGKKDKSDPLTAPLQDDSASHPLPKKQ
ncbi:MAG: MCE family protein [Bacteroidota bacterium]|nr:MCE family protein [Bacteroidota bacterium]